MAEVPDAGSSAMDVDAAAYAVTDKITLVSLQTRDPSLGSRNILIDSVFLVRSYLAMLQISPPLRSVSTKKITLLEIRCDGC